MEKLLEKMDRHVAVAVAVVENDDNSLSESWQQNYYYYYSLGEYFYNQSSDW